MLWVPWSWGMMAAQSSLVDSSKLLNEARTPVVVIGPPKLPNAAGHDLTRRVRATSQACAPSGRAQLHGIPHEESGGEAPLLRFALGDGDGGRGGIDAGGRKPKARSHERVLARSAADVEHTSLQRPRLRQLEEGRLRTADVPGRCTGVRGIEVSAGRWMRDAAGSAVVSRLAHAPPLGAGWP